VKIGKKKYRISIGELVGMVDWFIENNVSGECSYHHGEDRH
jgi:hypothetical protein